MDLLISLIVLSQKAANIARVCRQDEHLFELLVQKKKNEEANPRFVQDFKTLADVLIQEMVKHDVIAKFPELSDSIRGEESNIFKNKLGETICVEVKASHDETSCLLEKVLNGDKHAAKLLAIEVHRDINIGTVRTIVPNGHFEVDLSNIGVWIDPIDCTGEYIHGNFGNVDHNIDVNGLKCVTVLIGVYNKVSGLPIMGVINRPFVDQGESFECLWGVSLPNYSKCVVENNTEKTNVICISNSEKDEIKTKLKEVGFYLVEAAGAGFKILTVILGFADAYIISKGTTFKWDTCAPHSILQALGGDVVDYKNTIENRKTSIVYSCDKSSCNSTGVIAYRNDEILNEIINILGKL